LEDPPGMCFMHLCKHSSWLEDPPGMCFMHLCKHSSWLEDPPGMCFMHLCKPSNLKSAFCWLTLHKCITMRGTKSIKMGTYYLYWNYIMLD